MYNRKRLEKIIETAEKILFQNIEKISSEQLSRKKNLLKQYPADIKDDIRDKFTYFVELL